MQEEKDEVGVGEEPRNNHNGEQQCAVVINAQLKGELHTNRNLDL